MTSAHNTTIWKKKLIKSSMMNQMISKLLLNNFFYLFLSIKCSKNKNETSNIMVLETVQ